MSNGMIITDSGRNLLALALTGYELKFTRGGLGDGSIGSKDPTKLYDLIHPVLSMNIQSMRVTGTGTCEVVFDVSNEGLSSGFWLREYGVFAYNPVSRSEVLYAYTNNGNYSGYLEADNGVHHINFALTLTTVVEQAPNVTAVISTSNNYVTISRLDARIADLYTHDDEISGVWTFGHNSENRFTPTTWHDFKHALVGEYDISSMHSRIKHLEDNLARALLTLEDHSLEPEYSHYILEDFREYDSIDTFAAQITSIVAGDDSINCEIIDGITPGGIYTISDGVQSEHVQVESVNIENNAQRVILVDPVVNTYNTENTKMMRTSAALGNSYAASAGPSKALTWKPNITWTGKAANSTDTFTLDTSVLNSRAFDFFDSAALNQSGYITLGGY